MGQKILLDGANFTDARYPVIRDDKALTPGSLMLLDLSHSLSGVVGVPATNQAMYNIAWNEAKTLLGQGDKETLKATFLNSLGSAGILERTPKGGLHGIVSQASKASNQNAQFYLPDLLRDYLCANPSRHYAVFIWYRITRTSPNIVNMREFVFGNTASIASNNLFNVSLDNTLGTSSGQRTSQNRPTGWEGVPNSTVANNIGSVPAFGNTIGYTSLNTNGSRSYVLYRVHIVDVAASGKTFAELEGDDIALHTAAFSSGGKFHGDTYTDPAVLP